MQRPRLERSPGSTESFQRIYFRELGDKRPIFSFEIHDHCIIRPNEVDQAPER